MRRCQMKYPDHFFCTHCEDYVEAMILSSRRSTIKRNSDMYFCQGHHTSFIHPTTKKANQTHNTLLQRFHHGYDDVEDNEEDIMHPPVIATPIIAMTTTTTPASSIDRTPHQPIVTQGRTTHVTPATMQTSPSHDALIDILAESGRTKEKELVDLQAKYASLLIQVEVQKLAFSKLQKKYDDWVLRYQTYLAKAQDPMLLLTRAINLPFKDAREFDGTDAVNDSAIIKRKKAQKLVVNVLMQTQFFDGLVWTKILKQAKRYFKEEVFSH
jgi:hypothetical protein